MPRFQALPTISGGEVFDTLTNRPFEPRPSYEAAQREASRLNRLVAGEGVEKQARVLARETIS